MILNKHEEVYLELKNRILNGELKNNSKVTERGLAEALNVTRIPVREALAKLGKDGLIKKIPRAGHIVENYSSEEFSEALLLRFTIECQAARKAAVNATQKDISIMEIMCEKQKDAGLAGHLERRSELDREFHTALVSASHSKILEMAYSLISIPVFRPRTTEMPENLLLDTFRDHENILTAIKEKDPDAAFEAAFKHTPGRNMFKQEFIQTMERLDAHL